jgi:hypothetical protein
VPERVVVMKNVAAFCTTFEIIDSLAPDWKAVESREFTCS